jgi:hypothetical protein
MGKDLYESNDKVMRLYSFTPSRLRYQFKIKLVSCPTILFRMASKFFYIL